eukprot:c12092_g1_i2 orf=395-2980(-)
MTRVLDGKTRKRQRLGPPLADTETLPTLENKLHPELQQQNGALSLKRPATTEEISKPEWALRPHSKESLSNPSVEQGTTSPQMGERSAKDKDTQMVLQRLKQTEKRGKKGNGRFKRLSANAGPPDVEKDEACSQQLEKLRLAVERFGGKLEDGWYVNSQRRSNNGIPFFIFMSPNNERFRSRVEVVRHLGLHSKSEKNSHLPRTRRSLTNSQLALVPYDRKNKSLIKSSKGKQSLRKPMLKSKKKQNRGGKAPNSLKAAEDVNDFQVTSTSSVSASFITQRCQDVLRNIISTESFASLSNMVNQGTPPSSLEATLQLKAPLFVTGLDLKLIHLRLSTGAYGQTPELFSADIQQVWKNIITAGNELILLARSLSELSDNLYKQQIMSLFDGPSKESVVPSKRSNEQLFDDTYAHVGPLSERVIARPTEGFFSKEKTASECLGRPAGLSAKGGFHHRSMPSTLQSIQARLQKQFLSKKAATKARHQLSKKMRKKAGMAKSFPAPKGRIAGSTTESVCQKCGLKQGAEYAVCKQCKSRYHTHCVVPVSTAGEWCCPSCSWNQIMEIPCTWAAHNKGVLDKEIMKELLLINSNTTIETGRELQKSTGKTGVCEACKKEDDNVLLCDACDAAYHMSCLSPSIDSVPDGYWYCPACDEAGKKTMVSLQDVHVHNCAVCDRVSRELLHCAENESTAQVFSKDTSPVYLAPERSIDHGCPEHSLNQGLSEPCVENKSSEPSYLAGSENTCKLCGVDEDKKSILCANCGKCYHLSCLRPPLRKRPRKTWYCPSCLCRACKNDADDDKILLCDSCDEGYHTYCLNPPIQEIPEEAWYCPSCREAKNIVHTSPSTTEGPKKKRKSNEPRRSM